MIRKTVINYCILLFSFLDPPDISDGLKMVEITNQTLRCTSYVAQSLQLMPAAAELQPSWPGENRRNVKRKMREYMRIQYAENSDQLLLQLVKLASPLLISWLFLNPGLTLWDSWSGRASSGFLSCAGNNSLGLWKWKHIFVLVHRFVLCVHLRFTLDDYPLSTMAMENPHV